MAEIIQFQRSLSEPQEEYGRTELIVKLWVPLANALREMKALGADRPQVIRMLRSALELMEEDEAVEGHGRAT